jgi:hypothetical protein
VIITAGGALVAALAALLLGLLAMKRSHGRRAQTLAAASPPVAMLSLPEPQAPDLSPPKLDDEMGMVAVGPLAPMSAGAEALIVAPKENQALIEHSPPNPSRLRLLGLVLGMLTEQTRRERPPQLGTAIARLADGDQEMARTRLSTLALALMGEDQSDTSGESQLGDFLAEVLEGELANGLSFSSMPEFQQALAAVAPELRRKLDTIVWSRNADAVNMLTEDDVEILERVAVAMATAHVIDTTYRGRASGGATTESDEAGEAVVTSPEAPAEAAQAAQPDLDQQPAPDGQASSAPEAAKPAPAASEE